MNIGEKTKTIGKIWKSIKIVIHMLLQTKNGQNMQVLVRKHPKTCLI